MMGEQYGSTIGAASEGTTAAERGHTTATPTQLRFADLPITLDHWEVIESGSVELDESVTPGFSVTYRSDYAACELSVRTVRERLDGERTYQVKVTHYDPDSGQPAGQGDGLTYFGEATVERFSHTTDSIEADIETFLELNSY